jgi:hypothetical protein
MSDRAILVFSADHHGGHALGLLSPDTLLSSPDGEPYCPRLCKTQEYLWEDRWIGPLKEIKHWAGRSPVHVLLGGDLGQGNKHQDEWVRQTTFTDQAKIIQYNIEPVFDIFGQRLEAIEIAIGTGAHNFGTGGLEITARDLIAEKHPKTSIDIAYHSRSSIHGCLVDMAHHGPWPGSRSWLEGNGARYYLRDAMIRDYNVLGKQPSKIYFRAHYHYQVCERVEEMLGGERYESWLIEVPSLCGLGDYAHKATRSTPYIINGICAIEIVDGEPRMPPMWFTRVMDIRTERSYG